jgi:inorganic pyrophosphatase
MTLTSPPPPFYRFRPHPWHGLEIGPQAPNVVNAYIEITPFDTMKYEIDKATGYLRLDRPQRGSAQPPTLYGFIPRTYCAARVAALSPTACGRADGDPLDICVISERPIMRAEILVRARVVGGIQMIDDDEADDKIVAVLENDPFFSDNADLSSLPKALVDRLIHYFTTYKLMPGANNRVSVAGVYDREHAWQVVDASATDYLESYDQAPPTLQF